MSCPSDHHSVRFKRVHFKEINVLSRPYRKQRNYFKFRISYSEYLIEVIISSSLSKVIGLYDRATWSSWVQRSQSSISLAVDRFDCLHELNPELVLGLCCRFEVPGCEAELAAQEVRSGESVVRSVVIFLFNPASSRNFQEKTRKELIK